MVIEEPLLEATFIRRYKRFLMDVRLANGRVLTVHCPNSGSMEGCLAEGAPVICSKAANEKRKLAYTAECIRLPSGWVGINTHRTNLLAGEALRAGWIPELANYKEVKAEVPYGQASRIDFLLTSPDLPPCFVEVKNTTWPTPDGGVGFPDAITDRGLKHLKELRGVVRKGGRAIMLYVVNREDGAFFRPALEKDRAYARGLAKALRAGVEIMARRVAFALPELKLDGELRCFAHRGRTLIPAAAYGHNGKEGPV